MYKQKMVFNVLAIWFLLHIGFVYGQVNSLYFDGSDDYVEVSHNSAFSLISKKIFIFSYV